MIKNFFVTALRSFWRNRAFSLINVLGLSIGISAALVIFLIVHYEYSYDRFEKDGDRIYRVVLDMKMNGISGHSAAVPAPLGPTLAREATGIEATVPLQGFQGDGTVKVTIERNDASPVVYKKQDQAFFANSDYFRMLQYKWLNGTATTALAEPFTLVLTEARASQYFPGLPMSDIIGRKVIYNDTMATTVTGIVANLNEQTVFGGEEFISFPTISKTGLARNFMMDVWDDWMAYSHLYIKLAPGTSEANVKSQLATIANKYINKKSKDPNHELNFGIQPLAAVHFDANYNGFGQRIVSKSTLLGLALIGGFLLLLGCFNFINLTTAQASRRAMEIGIRKTMGSSRTQLVLQFLGEAFVLVLGATLLSVLSTPLLLRVFKDFIPDGLHFDLMHQPAILFFLIMLIAGVSLLAGFYPALVLSGFRPVSVLKNQVLTSSGQNRNAWVRKTLTVSQFAIAQFFVIAALMVTKQINFSMNSDLGFNKEAVIYFRLPRDTVKAHIPQLLQQVRSTPGVALASSGFMAPADEGAAFTNISVDNGKELIKPAFPVQLRTGNPEYMDVYQIKLAAGRNVMASDTMKEVLVNEKFAVLMGYQHPADMVGTYIAFNRKMLPVVGVMKDFHDMSMHGEISAVMFGSGNGSTLHLRLAPNQKANWSKTIASVSAAFHQIYPDAEFNYSFMDETIAKLYAAEQKTARLLTWAMTLTVIISCLGLLGLVTYTTRSRTREIGIRKILGASVTNIMAILSKDFLVLVLLAFVVAAPLAYWAVYSWLEDFAYRTDMSWWVFAIGGLGMVTAALLTLSAQTIQTARANPVKSLRTE